MFCPLPIQGTFFFFHFSFYIVYNPFETIFALVHIASLYVHVRGMFTSTIQPFISCKVGVSRQTGCRSRLYADPACIPLDALLCVIKQNTKKYSYTYLH